MAAHCKEMMGAQRDETMGHEATKMREQCEEMAPAREGRSDSVAVA